MNISEYESREDLLAQYAEWSERAALDRSVAISRQQFAEGKFRPHAEVMANAQTMLDEMKASGLCK